MSVGSLISKTKQYALVLGANPSQRNNIYNVYHYIIITLIIFDLILNFGNLFFYCCDCIFVFSYNHDNYIYCMYLYRIDKDKISTKIKI